MQKKKHYIYIYIYGGMCVWVCVGGVCVGGVCVGGVGVGGWGVGVCVWGWGWVCVCVFKTFHRWGQQTIQMENLEFGNTHLRDPCIQRVRYVIHKQNSFEITSRGIQGWTSTDFRLKYFLT